MTIAEESTSWSGVSRPTYIGRLGFTFKWNMGWMHDMLDYFGHDSVHRRFHQNQITIGLLYAFNENFVLVLSHDEVVQGKRALLDKIPSDERQRFANRRSLYGFRYAHPGKKMLFMGGEFRNGVSGTTTPAWNGISAISSGTKDSGASYKT